MKRTHLSTWRLIFKQFNCVLHNYIIFIIVIFIGCPILNCMIHYNVCNSKGKYCTILWVSGNNCGRSDLVIPLGDCLKLKYTPCTTS